jgi:hypothetical protein
MSSLQLSMPTTMERLSCLHLIFRIGTSSTRKRALFKEAQPAAVMGM